MALQGEAAGGFRLATVLTERERRVEGPHKVIVVGDSYVGKTSLLMRYVAAKFDPVKLKKTLGVDFALKQVERPNEPLVRLQLWDIAGQERFNNLTRVYYRQAIACIIVFDLTRHSTFEHVREWKSDVDSKVNLANGEPVPCLLLANKCDLAKRQVTHEEIEELSKELGFIGFAETSALANIKVDESMMLLVNKIVSLIDDESAPPTQEGIAKLQERETPKVGSCC